MVLGFFFNKVVSMEVSALYSLNIYVFDLGIQIKLSTQGAMGAVKVSCK